MATKGRRTLSAAPSQKRSARGPLFKYRAGDWSARHGVWFNNTESLGYRSRRVVLRRVRSSPCATRRAMLTPLPEAPECGRVPATCAGTARAAHGPCRARSHRQEFSRRHEVLIQRQPTQVLGHAGPLMIRLFSSGVSAPEIGRGRWWRDHLQEAPFVTGLCACSLFQQQAFGDGDAEFTTMFGDCHVGNAVLPGETLLRLRPDRIVELA